MLGLVRLSAAFDSSIAPKGAVITARVVGVMDGDTLRVLTSQNQQIKVRLAQIDAPEKKQAFGNASKNSLSDLVFGKVVQALVADHDRYGRVVAEVALNGLNINQEQVRRGMAWVYVQYAKDAQLFEIERQARKAKIGLWADSSPTAPWLYRHDQ